MLENLEKYFRTAFTAEFDPKDTNRFWFQTDAGEKFGILKTSLSDDELNLVKTLFIPIENLENDKDNSTIQQKWYEFLYKDLKELPFLTDVETIRFFYFYLKHPIDDPSTFEEAITGCFQQPVILWNSSTHGCIIEEKPQTIYAKEEFSQLIDTLTNDFLVKIYGYMGQLHKAEPLLKEKFDYEYTCFNEIHQYADREKSITFYKALPLLLVESPSLVNKDILSNLFIESIQEQETLHTIQTFLQSDLNASLTAKKLYIHRNSLQYRLDKFIEKTGIDIRSFANAAFVFLAILLMNKDK